MVFQIHKVIILALFIFSLTNIIPSYSEEDQNQNENYVQIEEQVVKIKPIEYEQELFQYNTLSLIVCLFYIN